MPPIQINLKPDLYSKQFKYIFDPSRYVFIEASTKSGKTFGCMQWIIHRSQRRGDGANYWWVAPVFRQARIAYLRIKRGLIRVPNYKQLGFKFREGDLRIEMPNGAILSFLSGDDSDNLYGDDVQDGVIDEASRVKEESWNAIRSTLTATNGHLRIIGNVKGKGNWFYRLSRLAANGDFNNAKYFKLTAYDAAEAGVITLDEIADAKRTLPENVFRELYLAEPSDDGGNPFGLDAIDRCIAPLSTLEPIVFGLDLGKSNDYTVLIGLDRLGAVCYFERWKTNWGATINKVKDVTKGIKVYADATGVGDAIVENLMMSEDGFDGSFIEPFKFTSMSKQQIMEGLSVAIQKNTISYPEGHIAKELRLFEYENTRTGVRYTAPVGYHDDCVCSLALANKGITSLTTLKLSEENFTDSFHYEGSREVFQGWIDSAHYEELREIDAEISSLIIEGINDPKNWVV